jgi:hypothetical protein
VFFDPTAEEPRSLDEDVEALFIAMSEMAMRRAGIDPSLIYASRKTGLIVTERNQHLLSGDDRADWIEAIFEYEGEAIRHHLQEAHGREYVAAAKEAGRIYAEHAERICPHCSSFGLDSVHGGLSPRRVGREGRRGSELIVRRASLVRGHEALLGEPP